MASCGIRMRPPSGQQLMDYGISQTEGAYHFDMPCVMAFLSQAILVPNARSSSWYVGISSEKIACPGHPEAGGHSLHDSANPNETNNGAIMASLFVCTTLTVACVCSTHRCSRRKDPGCAYGT